MNSLSRRNFIRSSVTASILASIVGVPAIALADESVQTEGSSTDFSFLDDMTDSELKTLQEEITKRLGATSEKTDSKDSNESNNSKDIGISWNTPIETDSYAFTLTGSEWADAVYPPDVSSVYSYIPDTEGNTYLVIRGTFENRYSDTLNLEYISTFNVIINEEYNFNGSVQFAKPDSSNLYSTSNEPSRSEERR